MRAICGSSLLCMKLQRRVRNVFSLITINVFNQHRSQYQEMFSSADYGKWLKKFDCIVENIGKVLYAFKRKTILKSSYRRLGFLSVTNC